MRKRVITGAAAIMALILIGCGGNQNTTETANPEENVTASENEATAGNGDQEENYVFPDGVTVSDSYEKYETQVSFGRIMDDWYDADYQWMSIDSHTEYLAEEEGYDLGDQITISLATPNPLGVLEMSICKKVTYIHNEATGEWELSKEAIKTWKREDKNRLNKTSWKRHFDDVSELEPQLFVEEGESLIPELEAGKAADFYAYFRDDNSFFTIKVNPNSGITDETIFYTEGTADIYLVYEGETYMKTVHFVEGIVTDKGQLLIKPEDGEVYFELIPAMNLISEEEIKNL